MAVPTLTSGTPALGPTAGGMMVTLTGTNFRLPTIPVSGPSTGFDAISWPQSMAVFFDGVASPVVKVLSATTVTATIPAHVAGAVTVTVTNVDDSGEPIAGESASVAALFTYTVPKLGAQAQSGLGYLVRTLIRFFKMTLNVDVTMAVKVDYDATLDDEMHVTKFAQLPGMTIIGPKLKQNRFYSLNENPTYLDGTFDGEGNSLGFVETKVPYTVDATFDLIGASDNGLELINLMSNLVATMHATKYLAVNRVAPDSSHGQFRIEMDFAPDGEPSDTTTPNNNSLCSFSASILLRGVDIEGLSGIDVGAPINGIPGEWIANRGTAADEISLDPTSQIELPSDGS